MDVDTVIAARVREGAALSPAEIDGLAAADVLALGMLADDVRRARLGSVVGYRRVIDVDAAAGAGALDRARIGEAELAEVRIGGVPASLDEAAALVRECRAVTGRDRALGGFSLADLVDRAAAGWGALPDVLHRLRAAGLQSVAEAPLDLLAAPEAALEACAAAGLGVGRLSIDEPAGDRRSGLLAAMRRLADRFPGIGAVAPLARRQPPSVPTTGYDDVRMVALARLVVPPACDVEVDWTRHGPKLAQVALTFGANVLDRVPVADDPALGWRRASAEEVRRQIAAAGFTPVDRLARS